MPEEKFPFKKVEKRNGRIADFDQSKITEAIWSAARAVGGTDKARSEELSDKVVEHLAKHFEGKIPNVEDVQDAVEKILIEEGHAKTAKAYILYRKQRENLRKSESTRLEVENLVDSYVSQREWRIRENANVKYSMPGLYKHASGKIISNYALDKVYPEEISGAHRSGDLHIHDLAFGLSGYCAGWGLESILLNGFGGVPGHVTSKPPKHLDTALLQAVNFLGTLQGEWAGAQALNSVDTLLAPFVAHDGLSYVDVKQAMQKFVFNLNVLSRWGSQSPFTNVTMDWTPPPDLAERPAIIGGEPQEDTYADYQDEMDMINRAFIEVLSEGDANGRPFSFPIPTYNMTPDFDYESENAERLFDMAAKYGLPYFSNFVNSDMDPSDIRSMCPLGPDEKVLVKSKNPGRAILSTFKYLYHHRKSNLVNVYSEGKFVWGRLRKYDNQEMIKVTLHNGHEITMSKTHLNFVKRSEGSETKVLNGDELEEEMYLPYSLAPFNEGKGGTKETGYFVGACAGDGTINENGVQFSLNQSTKLPVAEKLKKIAEEHFGAPTKITRRGKSKLSLQVKSHSAVGLCKDFLKGSGTKRCYKPNIFLMSKEFREGLIEGHMATDGGNRNRIYTSSEKMVEYLNALAATLGTTTSVYTDDRGRDETLSDNPNYVVLIYQLNRDSYDEIWFKESNRLWVRIKSIEEAGGSTAYCLEIANEDPVFTVASTGILTHNCRLRIETDELERNVTGGLFGSGSQTGSLGVVTINLPRIAYHARNEDWFFQRLTHLMRLASKSLQLKREIVEKNLSGDLLPYSKRYLGTLKNHFNTIGLVGGNEACENFLGEGIASREGQEFMIKVLEFMLDRLGEFRDETGLLYNLEATPAEGTCYRLARLDKSRYPDIKTAGENTPYYTNSTHLPVGETDDLFATVEHQEPLQKLYTGGTVLHAFVGERLNAEGARTLVRKLTEGSELPYYTITPTYSICPNHGYRVGEHYECPDCSEACEVYSRVVGYYRPVQQWNDGKQEEFGERKHYDTRKALGARLK